MKKSIFFLVMVLFINNLLAQVCTQATPQFCDAKKKRIEVVCHSHKEGGTLVYFDLPDGNCVYCVCSCVGSNTPVAIENSKWAVMGDIKVGEKVLALQKDNKWISSDVIFSDGTEGSIGSIPYAIYLTLSSGVQLVTTADHIFLLENKKLRRADRLSPNDNLLDANMKPVKITQLIAGEFKGFVHNIAVGKWDRDNINFDGHFINTNGVISGDYYVQTIAKEKEDIGTNLPQIGSAEYSTAYKAALKNEKMLSISLQPDEIKLNDNNSFIPFKSVVIPKNAVNFLPKEYEEALPGTLSKLDNSIPYEVANYIIYNYKRFYPDVTYHIDWTNNSVNAYAYMEGNSRHVVLLGGLIRHNAIQQEGLGLVLAHELGHHYGGAPRYPDNPWASCEGQADYWGALVGERNVWWGPYALQQIDKGSQQLYNLFAYGLRAGNLFEIQTQKSFAGICTHPPAACRLSTYRAGLYLDEKPICAGDPPSVTK